MNVGNNKISNNMTGVAGEYYVCAELCRRNILALITPKNNPLFDIIATDPIGKRSVAIQVKTMSIENNQGWKLGLEIENKQENPNLFVVLVNMKNDGTNDFYIYEYNKLSERVNEIFQEYISTPKRDGTKRKEVNFRWFDFKDFNQEDKAKLNNWKILGF
jgi:hypothetical protein